MPSQNMLRLYTKLEHLVVHMSEVTNDAIAELDQWMTWLAEDETHGASLRLFIVSVDQSSVRHRTASQANYDMRIIAHELFLHVCARHPLLHLMVNTEDFCFDSHDWKGPIQRAHFTDDPFEPWQKYDLPRDGTKPYFVDRMTIE